MNINKSLKDILIGVLLGDASIGRSLNKTKAFISFEQSSKKLEYIQHLQNIVKEGGLPLVNEDLKEYIRIDHRYNSQNSSLSFRTQLIEELKPIADLFLNKEGKKIIPPNIADHLTSRSLAYWIMDDGQRVKKGGITLCTDSYTKDEIKILRDALKNNFNLETTIHNKKGKNEAVYERIYIIKEGFEKFKPSLLPHMHESMLYKINEEDLIIKQDSSDIDSEVGNIFDIGES